MTVENPDSHARADKQEVLNLRISLLIPRNGFPVRQKGVSSLPLVCLCDASRQGFSVCQMMWYTLANGSVSDTCERSHEVFSPKALLEWEYK